MSHPCCVFFAKTKSMGCFSCSSSGGFSFHHGQFHDQYGTPLHHAKFWHKLAQNRMGGVDLPLDDYGLLAVLGEGCRSDWFKSHISLRNVCLLYWFCCLLSFCNIFSTHRFSVHAGYGSCHDDGNRTCNN